MTIAVDLGHKATKQTNKHVNEVIDHANTITGEKPGYNLQHAAINDVERKMP